jgi:cyclopropane fatty-acyl-phospholipid synthase-like methyltransferase
LFLIGLKEGEIILGIGSGWHGQLLSLVGQQRGLFVLYHS